MSIKFFDQINNILETSPPEEPLNIGDGSSVSDKQREPGVGTFYTSEAVNYYISMIKNTDPVQEFFDTWIPKKDEMCTEKGDFISSHMNFCMNGGNIHNMYLIDQISKIKTGGKAQYKTDDQIKAGIDAFLSGKTEDVN